MQTRRQGTKGPGQGDSAVAQEQQEKEVESLKEMEPSSATFQERLSVEREVEAMKESTSKPVNQYEIKYQSLKKKYTETIQIQKDNDNTPEKKNSTLL